MENKDKLLKIKFLPHEISINIKEGRSLLDAAMDAGVHINASCGGEGVCGKCRVIVEKGEFQGGESSRLSEDDMKQGYRLACRTKATGDVEVRVPVESGLDPSTLKRHMIPRKKTFIEQEKYQEIKEKGLVISPVKKIYLELPEPGHGDNVPDLTRLIDHLAREHDEHRLHISLPIIRKLPDVMREEGFKLTVTLERPVRETGKTTIANVQPGDMSGRNYTLAIDIGTTTVFGQLIDLHNGETLAELGNFNGQISYGEDVISRIVYAEKPGGLERLNSVVIGTINKIIKGITAKARVRPDEVTSVTIAGNTTMTQLFLKINPKYIRRSPYVPAANFYPPMSARTLGIELGEHTVALVYPTVSSYVGGDIVAGIMGSGMYRSEEMILFIDIGTNAEIVIGNREWLACAACSAGPAFEGGGIKHGMRADKGAIEDISIDPVTFEPMTITVGRVRPVGICGSGLITMVATMLELGIIDRNGKYNRDLETPRIRQADNVYEYVVSWEKDNQIDRDIVLTEIDIDNLIRAKGAIYSGYQTLLTEVGLTIDDIDRIYLAGGFGSYIDLEKAMVIGLFPEIDAGKLKYIGNSSLMGARMSSLTNRIRRDVVDVVLRITGFELSETPSYMGNYTASQFLPHTDMTYFPKLNERLKKRREDQKR